MMNGESRFSLHATLLLLSILLPATLLHQSAAMVNELEFQIYEEVPIGTTIADLNRAIWKDSKPPGNLWNRFKIVNSEDPTSRLVEVSDKGRLLVARRIDREEICPTYGLPLLLGVDSFQDVPRSLNPSIGEAARRLMLSGSKSMFSIGDEQCSFLLKVAVAQQPEMAVGAATISTPTIPSLFPNGQESILEIRIIVIDVNDNEPFWPNNLQSHAIEFRDGDPAGKRQSLPLAIDLDRDENAQLTYSLGRDPSGYHGVEKDDEWNNLPFYLVHNPAEGLYLQTTREVDHEEASSYRLILKATDSVSKTSLDAQTPNRYRRPHTSSIPLKVVIQDINDNDPKFTRPVFMPSQPVLETTPVGSVILELTATDADSGNNGAFRFSFAPTAGWLPQVALAHHLFNVRPDGKVVVQNPLDVDRQWRMLEGGGGSRKTDGIYPKQKAMEFNFKVLVRDEAEPSYARSSEALVNIVVVDENDEAPEIKVVRSPSKECIQSLGRMGSLPDGGFQTHPTQPAYACVFENSPLDTLVVTLKVNDPDFGGEDEFECNISNKNFTLLPEDFANSRLPAHQVHQVFNRPFDKTKTAGPTQYAILTAAPLDRELMPFQKVHIICSDREGHRTTQNLSILVGDVNDNKPNFLQEVMHYQVPENSSPGTVLKAFLPGGGGGDPGAGSGDSWRNVSIAALRNVLAQDLDVGKNGRIKYLLEENSEHAGQFSIDQFTGAISTRVSFDREKTDKFMLTILAVDHGEPELTGTGTAQVTITDVNDNPPKFAQETYTFQILENMPRNSRVGQVTATDLDDLMVQGPITYYLSADHDALGFNIEAKTGELVTRRPLDREEQPNYTFKVLARDSSGGSSSFGHTQHTATATVNVVLEDVNDNSPVFITPNATANTLTVAVTQTLGHRLAFIHAEDADEGLNGQVTYKIKAGNSLNLFSIDPQSGLLFLAESLTRLAELPSLPLDGGSARKTGNDSDTEGENTARMLQLSTQPTVHVLTLEACDNAEEAPRCTVSTNLRIHVQPGASMLAGREEMRRYYADQHFHPVVSGGGENAVEGSSQLSGDQKAAGWGGVPGTGPRGGRGISAFVGSSSEIIIICMSVLFIILLVIILALTVFFRSCKLGPSKNLSISATQRSLSRSKSPAYTTSMHTAELGQLTSAELAISQSLTSSGAVLTGSQSSDMILDGLRHVGALPLRGGISSSQSFFEMPKSIHEFSCQGLMPCPEDVRNNFTVTGGVAGHAAGFQQTTIGTRQELARSADLLYLPKGSVNLVNKEGPMAQQPGQPQQPGHLTGHAYMTRNNVICFGENGEYQALRGAGLYNLEKTGADCLPQQMLRQQQPPATVNVSGHQHTHRPGQHKMFASNLACVPRFIMTGGTGTMIDLQQQQQLQQGYQLQGANDGSVAFEVSAGDKYNASGVEMAFNTYGRYVGLQPNIRSPESLDPARQPTLPEAHPRATYRLLKRGHGVLAHEFPRSKSAHTVALAQSEGNWRFGQRRQHISESSVDLNGATLESTETGFRTVPRSETVGDPFALSSPAAEDDEAELRGISKRGTTEDLSLLLLHDSEGRSELSEPLLSNVSHTAAVSDADGSFSRPGKLIASAYREASFV